MRRYVMLLCLLWLAPVCAEEEAAPADGQLLEAVVVSGAQPGPGLWRVSRDAHVLWVLGTLSPVPKRMQWVSREVDQVLAESQQVLRRPGVKLKSEIGFFRGLLLLPAALGSRKNPDGARLVDVLPAELYARWQRIKPEYLGRSRSVEKRRPLFAADQLWDKAVSRHKLTQDSVVEPVLKKLLKRHRLEVIEPEVEIDIPDPRQAIREFAATPLDDVECFRQTLDRVEFDMDAIRARANAWATGDIEALRALPYTDQTRACADAVLGASVAQKRGLDDLRERLKQVWLEAAEAALARNTSTFAVLPMSEILKPDGYLAALQARGYEVEEP